MESITGHSAFSGSAHKSAVGFDRQHLWTVGVVVLLALLGVQLSAPLARYWNHTLYPLMAEDWKGVRPVLPNRQESNPATEIPVTNPVAVKERGHTIPLSLVGQFEPVELAINAASFPLALDAAPTADGMQRGTFRFTNGIQYRFEMRDAGKETFFLVDRNHNGNFDDDGLPYRSPEDVFEVTVEFPLRDIVPRGLIDGAYRLWVYRNSEGEYRQVALTQFVGRLTLPGGSHSAYIAENHVLDGDFSNDGVYVDLNSDGRIDDLDSYVAPGDALVLDGEGYVLRVDQ